MKGECIQKRRKEEIGPVLKHFPSRPERVWLFKASGKDSEQMGLESCLDAVL